MDILVTGGSGFIGSHLIESLLVQFPTSQILVIDNLSTGNYDWSGHNRVYVMKEDLFTLFSSKVDFFAEKATRFKISHIFHLAAQIDLRKSEQSPQTDTIQDVVGFLNMIEFFRARASLQALTLVFSSTGGGMYCHKLPPDGYTEELFASPPSPYGINKFTIENYLEYYHRNYGMGYTVLRYGNVYGPRQAIKGESGILGILYHNWQKGSITKINNGGLSRRDYIHVSDVVSANILGMSGFNSTFNVGTGTHHSVTELLETLESKGIRLHWELNPKPIIEIPNTFLDCSKLRGKGWSPKIDLANGLETLFGQKVDNGL